MRTRALPLAFNGTRSARRRGCGNKFLASRSCGMPRALYAWDPLPRGRGGGAASFGGHGDRSCGDHLPFLLPALLRRDLGRRGLGLRNVRRRLLGLGPGPRLPLPSLRGRLGLAGRRRGAWRLGGLRRRGLGHRLLRPGRRAREVAEQVEVAVKGPDHRRVPLRQLHEQLQTQRRDVCSGRGGGLQRLPRPRSGLTHGHVHQRRKVHVDDARNPMDVELEVRGAAGRLQLQAQEPQQRRQKRRADGRDDDGNGLHIDLLVHLPDQPVVVQREGQDHGPRQVACGEGFEDRRGRDVFRQHLGHEGAGLANIAAAAARCAETAVRREDEDPMRGSRGELLRIGGEGNVPDVQLLLSIGILGLANVHARQGLRLAFALLLEGELLVVLPLRRRQVQRLPWDARFCVARAAQHHLDAAQALVLGQGEPVRQCLGGRVVQAQVHRVLGRAQQQLATPGICDGAEVLVQVHTV
mmetsp:Transcript_23526/g.66154  ORF Transcript_23526/g.66154 Transcript_23526/m.66154 type:complete len:467 (-) Transcript_23526:184-1584(-)